ncbi:hypothetical protein DENSPDRAFT_213545 [Dentipellis sp. KUC8613]|nr:hypothetical protein DENSPDRAFT_213545 [Dentipellis sp. KUC8613]
MDMLGTFHSQSRQEPRRRKSAWNSGLIDVLNRKHRFNNLLPFPGSSRPAYLAVSDTAVAKAASVPPPARCSLALSWIVSCGSHIGLHRPLAARHHA